MVFRGWWGKTNYYPTLLPTPDYWVLCVDEKADSLEIDKEEIPISHLETFIRKWVQLVGFQRTYQGKSSKLLGWLVPPLLYLLQML